MTTPSPIEMAAKTFGHLLWLVGFSLIFVAGDFWKWGGLCTGIGYFLSCCGYRKEAERLRRDLEHLSPPLSGIGRSPAREAPTA